MSEHYSDGEFARIFSLMIGGMAIVTVILIILATWVVSATDGGPSDVRVNAMNQDLVTRVSPVATIAVGDLAESSAQTAEAVSGESVYQSLCVACHGAGVAGAPKVGDDAAWEPRIAKGIEVLYESSINGIGTMPAKGGNASLSDEAVKAAVDFMLGRETSAAQPAEAQGGDTAAAADAQSGDTVAAAATSNPAEGQKTYDAACAVCHAQGVAGAPKPGDAEVWKPRIAKGVDKLYEHSINGFNAMPAKGGNTSLSDDSVRAAVDYMLSTVN